MNSAWHSRLETVLHVIVNPQIAFNEIGKLSDYLLPILIQQSLKLRDIFEFIEVFFKFCIQVLKYSDILLKNFQQLIMTHLVRVVCRCLELIILLTKPLVKLRHLLLIILAEGGVLLCDDFVYFRQKVTLIFCYVHLTLSKYLAHQLRQILEIIYTVLRSLLDFVVQVPEVAVEVVDFEEVLVNQLLLRLKHVSPAKRRNAQHPGHDHLLLLFQLQALLISLAILRRLRPLGPRSPVLLLHFFCI